MNFMQNLYNYNEVQVIAASRKTFNQTLIFIRITFELKYNVFLVQVVSKGVWDFIVLQLGVALFLVVDLKVFER